MDCQVGQLHRPLELIRPDTCRPAIRFLFDLSEDRLKRRKCQTGTDPTKPFVRNLTEGYEAIKSQPRGVLPTLTPASPPTCPHETVEAARSAISLVTFMNYNLRYFDDERCSLEPLENPSGQNCYPCVRS